MNGKECADRTCICDSGECVPTSCPFALSPTEGTQITITNEDYGAKTGRVYIGKWKCWMLAWTDTSIICMFVHQLEPGAYAEQVIPYDNKLKDAPTVAIICPNGFTIFMFDITLCM